MVLRLSKKTKLNCKLLHVIHLSDLYATEWDKWIRKLSAWAMKIVWNGSFFIVKASHSEFILHFQMLYTKLSQLILSTGMGRITFGWNMTHKTRFYTFDAYNNMHIILEIYLESFFFIAFTRNIYSQQQQMLKCFCMQISDGFLTLARQTTTNILGKLLVKIKLWKKKQRNHPSETIYLFSPLLVTL